MTGTIELTASGLRLSVGAVSDIGLKRSLNEDSILVLPAVFVVADGMGGYESGDQASAAVVAAFRRVARNRESMTPALVVDALELADEGVARVAGRTSRGAGSTVAGAALVLEPDGPHWLIFNVGDSRVYRHAATALEQITVDHSLGQELYRTGRISAQELAVFKDRNVITRAIGAADAEADSWMMPVRVGERLLLCSDGLCSEVPDAEMLEVLRGDASPDAIARELVERAKSAGGRDNISVIVVDVLAGGRALPTEGLVEEAGELVDDSTTPIVTVAR